MPNGDTQGEASIYLTGPNLGGGMSMPIADVAGLSLAIQPSGPVRYGEVLLARSTKTADGNQGTGSLDNGASSTGGAMAILHVFATAGLAPSTVVTIEHSADNSSWAQIMAFDPATGVGTKVEEAAGTIQRYVRATWNLDTTGGNTTSVNLHLTLIRL
jgi:hypothetical protein